MKVIEEQVGGTLVVQPKGRMDSITSPDFERRLLDHVERGEASILIDGEQLEYASTAGLRTLLIVSKRLAAIERGTLRLCSLTEPIREIFLISGFGTIFTVYPDRDSALADMAEGGNGA